ncbi:hypothetical protein KAFR_0H02300 [Kazachstania africana CBS 2517]|uniref:Peptidase A1 domain-containing protein n=1 Tax=Kazachstania africana (strain ATCC 22294 / BCRC 22015 / CBS 2517 / CECT 1963 / NBRC 1671 / NRRL Y-8276) TaxID=1071382 RepID=H2AZ83_KAZAF|nr:hypothetical protein KAFR_0H02300 [Kazachstania africana CBS 2517]CCF59639.1 hypothetical protein KAFR_0H02300 [Kazachstania africana CBS 2517]
MILLAYLVESLFFIPNYSLSLPQIGGGDSKQPDYVNLKFKKTYGDSFEGSTTWSALAKRTRGYELVDLVNRQNFYSVDLDIGTPSQTITVLVDTGSSDLWVTGSDNPYCVSVKSNLVSSTNKFDCNTYGTFDKNQSSTWSSNDTLFSITYGDTSFARGTWGQDKLHLDDLDVSGLSFAVANVTNSTVGVLGIGLPGLEVTYINAPRNRYQYDNFPMILKNSGATHSNLYSLHLDHPEAEHGTVLFGAVDHSKYTGSLYTIPLVNTLKTHGFSDPAKFEVTLQGVGIVANNTQTTLTNTKIAALLDSGTTLTYLPQALVQVIADSIGARWSSRYGYYIVSCRAVENSDTTLVFDFGGFHINGKLTDFIVETFGNVCLLTIIEETGSNSAILGDNFLINAYVVFDLENNEISMAQALHNVDDDQDIEIVTSNAGVASAVTALGYSSTWTAEPSTIETFAGDIFTVSAGATANYTTAKTRQSSSDTESNTASTSMNRKNLANMNVPFTFLYSFPLLGSIIACIL